MVMCAYSRQLQLVQERYAAQIHNIHFWLSVHANMYMHVDVDDPFIYHRVFVLAGRVAKHVLHITSRIRMGTSHFNFLDPP